MCVEGAQCQAKASRRRDWKQPRNCRRVRWCSNSNEHLAYNIGQKGGHAYVIQQPAHLGQSLADTELLHEGMCEGCQTTVLWYISTNESSLANRFLHDVQRSLLDESLPLSVGPSVAGRLDCMSPIVYASLILMYPHSPEGLQPACSVLQSRADT